jgi:glucokinase
LHTVLVIDLGGTKCSAGVVDENGKLVRQRTIAADLSSTQAPVMQVVQLAKQLAGRNTPQKAFGACAIAVPGLVRRNGTVWAPNLPGWEKMPLGRRVQRSLRIPVVVESDRNAAVLGECWRGAARGTSDAVVLMIGTGIGAGIRSGGRILRGAHDLSGCAGWLTITREPMRVAGTIGELESLAAGPAIARLARERITKGEKSSLAQLELSSITAYDVATAARQQDALAVDVFRRAGVALGYGIANIVSLLDPQVVILGGGMASVAELYLDPLRDAMFERAQPLAAKQVKLVVSKLGDKANLLGCAHMAWKHLKGPG